MVVNCRKKTDENPLTVCLVIQNYLNRKKALMANDYFFSNIKSAEVWSMDTFHHVPWSIGRGKLLFI